METTFKLKYKPVKKINKVYSDDLELKRKLEEEINRNVDLMYQYYPASKLFNSNKTLIAKRYKPTVKRLAGEHNTVVFDTEFGVVKIVADPPLPSYRKAFNTIALEKLSVDFGSDYLGELNGFSRRIYHTSVCTRAITTSPELLKISDQIFSRIESVVKSRIDSDSDPNALNLVLRIIVVAECKDYRDMYRNAYFNAKDKFIQLFEKFGVKDYAYKSVSFRQIPYSQSLDINTNVRELIRLYDFHKGTNYFTKYEQIIMELNKELCTELQSGDDPRMWIRYYIDDIEYSSSDSTDDEY